MSEIAIRAENLSKQFRIGASTKNRNFREAIIDGFKAPFRRVGRSFRGQPTGAADLNDTIWALKDVSFEIEKGEVVGIIGRNGAGKSTLLKVLSRITEPTKGFADIRGRVGSLLEVGTGFHPELTGRENIYLNGAILGMKKADIQKKFDEIVAFSEVERFIDTPVKHYSSGMYLRLAFAVAAHLEPEILLVDEVLAVGDANFQKKCIDKIDKTAEGGRTVLFVSHNMGAINRLCRRAIWLDQGMVHLGGPTEEVVSKYLTQDSVIEGEHIWTDGISNRGERALKIYSVSIRNSAGQVTTQLDIRKPIQIEICYGIHERLPCCRIGFIISTIHGLSVFESYDSDDERYGDYREPATYCAQCTIPGDYFNAERYILSVNAGIPNIRNLAFLEGVLCFDIEDTGAVGALIAPKRSGVTRPKLDWEVFSK
jgi:lipopolysaccharide transport system ATP-binding protein